MSVDRLPTFPIMLAAACQLLGVKQGDFNGDPSTMAKTLIEARQLCGFDGVYVSRDNWVYHEALGGGLSFPDDDESFATAPVLRSLDDWRRLSLPDPDRAPGMKTVLAAARAVMTAVGDRFYVQANIDVGPFSLAAVLRGTEQFLLDLATEDPKRINGLLEFCTDVVIAYGKAMIATGVHGIQYGDATAGLVSPSDYAKFALPGQRRSLEALAGSDTDLWIHICGRTDHILGLLRGLPFHGFEVDAKVPLASARRLLGTDIAFKGNIDTTMLLQAGPEEVYSACRDAIAANGLTTGLILSPGCGVARMTPLSNLRAMLRAVEDQRV
jgi:uroporphyrinogen decarboxylase